MNLHHRRWFKNTKTMHKHRRNALLENQIGPITDGILTESESGSARASLIPFSVPQRRQGS